jgi:hypothetical protein
MPTVADVLWKMLAGAGVRRCYGIVGDALNPAIDALRRNGQIDFVHVRNEEWGVFAANAEARLSGRPVAVCGTAGPRRGRQGSHHSGGMSNTGTAFAKGFPHGWPILALIALVGLIVVLLLPRVPRSEAWAVGAAVAVAACTVAAYFSDKGKISDIQQTSGIGFTAVHHVGFTWGFYVTVILTGMTLALTLVGLTKD